MKKWKYKIIRIVVAIMVIFSSICIPTKQVMADTTSDGLVYTTNGEYVTITSYTGTSTKVTIPSEIKGLPVTRIGAYAFWGDTSLTNVTIPDSITSIDASAFYECISLTNVTIPNSVTSIGDYAFDNCDSLRSVIIPTNVTSIGNYVFFYCDNLTSVTILGRITSIGSNSFDGCRSLTNITMPDSITSIGEWAFANCTSLTNITIPENVTSIGAVAFFKCSGLTSVKIPDSVTIIGYSAFSECNGLTSITIPDSMTIISEGAFSECNALTSVTIPNNVAIIRGYAFWNCSGLTNVTIKNSLTSIKSTAFIDCSNISNVTIYRNPIDNSSTKTIEINGSERTVTLTEPIEVTAPASLEITRDEDVIIAELKKSDESEFTTSASVTYDWYRDENVIAGENGASYNLSDADKGTSIKVKVAQYGLESNEIAIPNDQIIEVTTPASVEIIRNEDTLTAELKKSDGSEFTTSASVTYDWYRDGDVIVGENGTTYELSDEDKGTSIKVKAAQYNLESNTLYIDKDEPQTTTSSSVSVSIKGTERVGNTLSAELIFENESESTTSAAVTYEWYRVSSEDSENGTLVGDNKTYKLISSDKDKYIKLVVYYDGKKVGTDITGKITGNSSSSSSSSSSNHKTTSTNNNNSTPLTEGWKQYTEGLKYFENGQPVINWNQIDNYWYLFDSLGVMQKGWKQSNNNWYFLKDNGIMATGWVQLNNNWYFLKENGAMATGWVQWNGNWYLLNDNGAMVIGWQERDSKWYYLYSNGAMASNTVINDFRVDSNGVWVN